MNQATPIPPPPSCSFSLLTKTRSEVKVEPQEDIALLEDVHTPEFAEPIPESSILHELNEVDRLIVTKRLHVKNAVFLRGKKNTFFVRTPDQNLVYTIEEDICNWWVGYLCFGLRPLMLHVTNSQGTEVMRIHRPYSCTARILPCHLQRLQIYSPPDHLIGYIQQQWTALKPLYMVLNESEDPVFWVRGPTVTLSFFRDVQFQIQRMDGADVGTTNKRWQGLGHALFFAPVTDKFGVTFDRDLTVDEKGLLLAVGLLMDYMYYDS